MLLFHRMILRMKCNSTDSFESSLVGSHATCTISKCFMDCCSVGLHRDIHAEARHHQKPEFEREVVHSTIIHHLHPQAASTQDLAPDHELHHLPQPLQSSRCHKRRKVVLKIVHITAVHPHASLEARHLCNYTPTRP